MRQIKGSMFIMFAKAIRADKQGTFDKFLTDQDRKILSELILQTKWYPYDTYKNCFIAVSKVVVNNNPERLKDWGREYGETTMTTIYKSAFLKNDPLAAIKDYQRIFKSQFSFGRMEGEVISDNEINITVLDFDNNFEPWYYVSQGWMERFIQLVINKQVRSEILERSWAGAPNTVYKMNW